MDAARQFEAARREICRVRDRGGRSLAISNLPLLEAIPVELTECEQLEEVSFYRTRIRDVSILAAFPDLSVLQISASPVSEIAYLKSLTELELLELEHTKVTNIEPLRAFGRLKYLNLSGTPATSFGALAELKQLSWLNLSGTRFGALDQLVNMQHLDYLNLRGTFVGDLKPLVDLSLLENLDIAGTQVADLRAVRNLPLKGEDDEDQFGLDFHDTLATRLDPELARLALVRRNRERTERVLAYLRGVNDASYDAFLARRRIEVGIDPVPSLRPVKSNQEILPISQIRSTPVSRIKDKLAHSYPDLRARCQHLVSVIQQEQAAHNLIPVPNSMSALAEYKAKSEFLDTMLAGLMSLHEDLPPQLPADFEDGQVETLREKLARIAEAANRGVTYLDQHEGTYGGLWKIGVISSVAGLISLVAGVSFLAASVLPAGVLGAQTVKLKLKRD